jgi:hypothetical protein
VTSTLLQLTFRQCLMLALKVLSDALETADPSPERLVLIDAEEQPEELKPIAAAFNDLQRRLTEAWNQQRTFIDGVAHEIRTPITLIGGYAERLERLLAIAVSENSEVFRQPLIEATKGIHAEALRTGRLVRDLLDLARKDSGRLELNLECCDAGDVMLAAYERLDTLASGRLRLHAPAHHEDLRVYADQERLDQCISSLVENALKYSPPAASVELSVERLRSNVVMHVRDHGPGVTPEERHQIFDLFARGSAAPLASVSGSGIGLAMVKVLMERMGGGVQVVNAAGGGADFQLLLSASPGWDSDSFSKNPTPRTV